MVVNRNATLLCEILCYFRAFRNYFRVAILTLYLQNRECEPIKYPNDLEIEIKVITDGTPDEKLIEYSETRFKRRKKNVNT